MASLMDIKAEQGDEPSTMALQHDQTEGKQRFKSYRKKYRKMKIRFDDNMEEANQMYIAENSAWEIAKRIQEQNDQIMEIILDMNSSLNTPANLRYDISSPSLAAVPELETHRAKISIKEEPTLNPCTLSTFRQTPHTTLDIVDLDKIPPELEDLDNTLPPGYFTSQHEEEYITALDASLASANPGNDVGIPGTHLFSQPRERAIPTERDFAIHHPSSVYNWLRVHQPQVFDTKDTEAEKGDTAPSKSKGKKEKTTKPELEGLEDEELEAMLAAGLGSAKGGKRKKDDETAYRPKGGHSRSSKRKRDKDDADGSKSGKKPKKSETIPGEEET